MALGVFESARRPKCHVTASLRHVVRRLKSARTPPQSAPECPRGHFKTGSFQRHERGIWRLSMLLGPMGIYPSYEERNDGRTQETPGSYWGDESTDDEKNQLFAAEIAEVNLTQNFGVRAHEAACTAIRSDGRGVVNSGRIPFVDLRRRVLQTHRSTGYHREPQVIKSGAKDGPVRSSVLLGGK